MAGFFECDNEPSGFIKCGEFLDKVRKSYLLRKASASWSLFQGHIILTLTFGVRKCMFIPSVTFERMSRASAVETK